MHALWKFSLLYVQCTNSAPRQGDDTVGLEMEQQAHRHASAPAHSGTMKSQGMDVLAPLRGNTRLHASVLPSEPENIQNARDLIQHAPQAVSAQLLKQPNCRPEGMPCAKEVQLQGPKHRVIAPNTVMHLKNCEGPRIEANHANLAQKTEVNCTLSPHGSHDEDLPTHDTGLAPPQEKQPQQTAGAKDFSAFPGHSDKMPQCYHHGCDRVPQGIQMIQTASQQEMDNSKETWCEVSDDRPRPRSGPLHCMYAVVDETGKPSGTIIELTQLRIHFQAV